MIVALCSVAALLAAPSLAQGFGDSKLTSPCPSVFTYDPPGTEPGSWSGVATLSTDILLHSMWLNIVLDSPAIKLGNWIGNSTTRDSVDFVIENDNTQIHPGYPLLVRFLIQYDPLNRTPRLRQLRLNGKAICNADTHQRATVGRPVLSNVKQPASSFSDSKITTNRTRKPSQSSQSDNYEAYPRPVNSSNAAFKLGNNYLSGECGMVFGGNKGDPFSRVMKNRREDIPWLVAVYRSNEYSLQFICGGTLVSDRHVITAAHCMHSRGKKIVIKNYGVKVGAHNVNDWTEDTAVDRKLVSVSIHEDFDTSTLKNDILILTLNKGVQFNDYIRPACLWSGNTELSRVVGASGIVAGWGVKSVEGTDQLGEPNIERASIVSTYDCRASHVTLEKIANENTLCAGERNGAGPCKGSAGAGLMLLQDGRWSLRGVVSVALVLNSTSKDCNLNEYVVYTDTAQFLPWIRNILSVIYID